jgi:hypothetical protein
MVDAEAVQAPIGTGGVALYQHANVGYTSDQDWQTDLTQLMSLLQRGAVQPSALSIWTSLAPSVSGKSWIDQVQMQVQAGGKLYTLNRYGRGGNSTTLQTLSAGEIKSITRIDYVGVENNNGNDVLGQLTFHFGSGVPSRTIGNLGDSKQTTSGKITPPPNTTLLGFTAKTGADVDGLAPIFG